MLKKLISVVLIFFVSVVSGCSATGPKFSQLDTARNSTATVYIYRPWMMLDGAAAPTIQLDGVDNFELSNGGFHILNLQPGNHKLTVKKGDFMSNWRAGEMNITSPFEANEIYFVRLSAELQDSAYVGGVMSTSGLYGFGLVHQEHAISELKETNKN